MVGINNLIDNVFILIFVVSIQAKNPLYHYIELQKEKRNVMDNYIQYTFYDETRKKIAIINKNTPKDIIKKLQEEYDEVKYKE